jgi:hypothetical protein
MKQYRKELEALDTALARERDRQLREMRQKMIRRKIEAERLKKEEEQDKRVQQIEEIDWQVPAYSHLTSQTEGSWPEGQSTGSPSDVQHAKEAYCWIAGTGHIICCR